MTEPKYRVATRHAIDQLAKELDLPNEPWMQDWPFEVTNPNDIEKYIAHYKITLDDDKKFVLMEAIIQATNDQEKTSDFQKYWMIIKPILIENFSTHEYSIYDWSCFEETEIQYCWTITPHLRQLWIDQNTNNRGDNRTTNR